MGYIYVITNLINSKKYVGKTVNTIDKRFKEHCKDSQKERCEKRPLYDAFRKYGIENFKIEELEYLEDDSKLSEREIYWINELQTYGHNGYNATKGGDGALIYDHNEILELYKMGYSTVQVAEKMGCESAIVRRVLKAHNIVPRGSSKIVQQYDLAGNLVQEFDSTKEAKQWLFDHGITTNKTAHKCISDCCSGRRNNKMYGYIWKHKEIKEIEE